jgi:hypothetical protein
MNDPTFLAALSLFLATDPDPSREGPDPIAEAIFEEFGPVALVKGFSMLAGILREELRRHSSRLGCRCGDAEWLRRLMYEHAAAGDP